MLDEDRESKEGMLFSLDDESIVLEEEGPTPGTPVVEWHLDRANSVTVYISSEAAATGASATSPELQICYPGVEVDYPHSAPAPAA